jgi:hypothetical protein
VPKSVGRRIQTSAYFDDEVFEALNTFSKKVGIPVAELIRRAVDDLLDRNNVKVKRKLK